MSDLKKQIEKTLFDLRYDCALQRLHLRNAHGSRWSGCQRRNPDKPDSWELHWENLQAEAQRERPKAVAAADERLAKFIQESRLIMGPDWPGTDHGRLCWSPFSGDRPINQFYCDQPEGHAGNHCGTPLQDDIEHRIAWPNSPLQEVTNEHQWRKLVELCPHQQIEESQCTVCGHKNAHSA